MKNGLVYEFCKEIGLTNLDVSVVGIDYYEDDTAVNWGTDFDQDHPVGIVKLFSNDGTQIGEYEYFGDLNPEYEFNTKGVELLKPLALELFSKHIDYKMEN